MNREIFQTSNPLTHIGTDLVNKVYHKWRGSMDHLSRQCSKKVKGIMTKINMIYCVSILQKKKKK